MDAVKWESFPQCVESFIEEGPSGIMEEFLKELPEHQVIIKKNSNMHMETKRQVHNAVIMLQAHMTDINLNPSLMFDFNSTIPK